jgi:hypothetical protein
VKSFIEIYQDIKNKFYNRTNLDIEAGTAIDSYNVAVSDALSTAYQEIEDSKDPHIYTNLKSDRIDSMGLLVNCARIPNEDDISYLNRLVEWNSLNAASNLTAIDRALFSLTYSSTAVYVPLTNGVSTGTCYIFPKSYDGDGPLKATTEVINRITKVNSPSVIVTYKIPDIKSVKVAIYISTNSGDIDLIKSNIKDKVKKYVNSIAPGDYLEVGAINKIGATEPNVSYFNVVQIYINEVAISSLRILQKLDSKLIFDDINWLAVNE